MQEAGLPPRQKKCFIPRITVADPAATAAPNVLLVLAPLPGPIQVRVSDITYIPTTECWLYLAAVMDQHTRRMPGFNRTEARMLIYDYIDAFDNTRRLHGRYLRSRGILNNLLQPQ